MLNGVVHSLRRKPPFAGLPGQQVKHAGMAYVRRRGNLPAVILVGMVVAFAMVMYGEDIKSLADHPIVRRKTEEYFSREALVDRSLPADQSQLDANRGKEEEGKEKKEAVALRELPITVDGTEVNDDVHPTTTSAAAAVDNATTVTPTPASIAGAVPETCDLSTGEWVYDDANYPLYREEQCEFLSSQVACLKNGRKENAYQKWRWQPKDCSLPRYMRKILLTIDRSPEIPTIDHNSTESAGSTQNYCWSGCEGSG